jgi:hypothetical protein
MTKGQFLPGYLIDHILSFVDFGTMIKNISVPVVYRYIFSLARYIELRNSALTHSSLLATVEPFYHLNRYKGLAVFDICRFLSGFRLPGANICLIRHIWTLNSQYHRIYGPAKTYRSITGQIFKEVWYQGDLIHRVGGPAVILYHDNGVVHREIYFRYDWPYSYNGGPTVIEYGEDGAVSRLCWHDSSTGRLINVTAYV